MPPSPSSVQLQGEGRHAPGGGPLPEGQGVVVGEPLTLPHQEGPILAPRLIAVFLQQLLGTYPLLHLLMEPLLSKMQFRGGRILGRKKRRVSENLEQTSSITRVVPLHMLTRLETEAGLSVPSTQELWEESFQCSPLPATYS